MATATRKTETVVVETVTGYTLNLTVREGIVLRAIMMRIGGPDTGHRGEADSIADALENAGVDYMAVQTVSDDVDENGGTNRAIYFGDSKVIND